MMSHGGRQGWQVIQGSFWNDGLFMARWSRENVDGRWLHHAAEDAKST